MDKRTEDKAQYTAQEMELAQQLAAPIIAAHQSGEAQRKMDKGRNRSALRRMNRPEKLLKSAFGADLTMNILDRAQVT